MTLNALQEEKIINSMLEYRKNQWDGTDAEFATSMGINLSVFSRLKHGERKNIIKSEKLVSIGQRLNVHLKETAPWNIVRTPVFEFITNQLAYCKEHSESRIFCDKADIGKTTAAKEFMLSQKNVYYVDCSQVSTRSLFIRFLAKILGVNSKGSIHEIYKDIVYMLKCMDRPLVILDEAGDLAYEAWLIIKSFWNALEGFCGWYMMGADGLKKKIETNIRNEKVGYAEIFRRYGAGFMSITPKQNPSEEKMFFRKQAEMIAHANLPKGASLNDFFDKSRVPSLTRIKGDINKIKNIDLFNQPGTVI